MEAFKDYSVMDWFLFASMVLIWFYLAAKAYRWFCLILIRRAWRWSNRKGEKALAVDSLYEAFGIENLKPGESITASTESGLKIQIYRPEVKPDA